MAHFSFRYGSESSQTQAGIVELLYKARLEFADTSLLTDPEDPDVADRLKDWLAEPTNILIAHQVDEDIVGILLATQVAPGIFADAPHMRVDQIFVEEGYRRRGVGRALMTQIALLAKEHELEWVVATPPTGDRPELRFLAGLGFAPVGTQRIAQTNTLLRKLELPTTSRERRLRSIDDLIARRKRAREIHNTPAKGIRLPPFVHHGD